MKNVFTEVLGINEEKPLLISDFGLPSRRAAPVLTGAFIIAARRAGLELNMVMQKPKFKGEKAEEDIVNMIQGLEGQGVLIKALSGRLGYRESTNQSIRHYLRKAGHRFISTQGLAYLHNSQIDWLFSSINVDYPLMRKLGSVIKQLLDDAHEVHITSPGGTDLYLSISGKKAIANVADYLTAGRGGNLPAGEVYLPPVKGKAEGVLVVDGSLRTTDNTYIFSRPTVLTIEAGQIVDIQGEGARAMELTLDTAELHSPNPQNTRLVSELGIGINPNARVVGPTIINEKALGTAHIAIGSNDWFGGDIKANLHLDQVFCKPKIELDGKCISLEEASLASSQLVSIP